MKTGRRWLGLVTAAMVAAWGCGGGDDPPPVPLIDIELVTRAAAAPCEAGRQAACPCLGGGEGVQVCGSDGRSWGACTGCSASTTSTGTGGGGAGGEGGAGGCQPAADPCTGHACGWADDGCGALVECPGHCEAGDVCTGGACCRPTTTCDGRCSIVLDDGCGSVHCDGSCNGGVSMTCDAVAGLCKCLPGDAGDPGAQQAVQQCSASGKKAVHCGQQGNPDAPAFCSYAGIFGNPGTAPWWCCPG